MKNLAEPIYIAVCSALLAQESIGWVRIFWWASFMGWVIIATLRVVLPLVKD